MPLIETALRYQPTERYPFIHSDLMDRDRLGARKPPEEGITYEFNETQLESGLFPGEEAKCKELFMECDRYMPEDKEKIRLALQLSLYGHQRQFRKSGEPYTYHPLAVALEAACEYKADWKTIALCLLHDLAEDSGKYGHSVMPYFVAKAYKNIGLRNDGLILAEGMRALQKIEKYEDKEKKPWLFRTLFSSTRNQAEIDTVKQIYDTVFAGDSEEFERARVVLVKLLDRKHNMETIRYLKPEKQIEKASETLHVYVNMAHAFGFYKLRDELFGLSYPVLYPSKASVFSRFQDEVRPVLESLEAKNITGEIVKTYPDYRLAVSFGLPSLYDYYLSDQQNSAEKNSFLFWRFMIPKDDNETTDDWRWRAARFFGFYATKNGLELIRDISSHDIETYDEENGEKMTAVVKVNDVTFRVEIISDRHFRREEVSLQDVFSSDENRKRITSDRLVQIKRDYLQIKESGDVSVFFEAVRGGKIIFNEKGNPLHFPPQSTLIDVLYAMYGERAFGLDAVRIRNKKGIGKIIRLSRFGETSFNYVLSMGDQIEKVFPGKDSNQPFIRLRYLTDCLGSATFSSLKVKVAEEILSIIEKEKPRELYIEDLRRLGERRIDEKYSEACSIATDSDDDPYFLKIPSSLLPIEILGPKYETYSDFLVAVALDIVDGEVFGRFIEAMVGIRKEVLPIDIEFSPRYPYPGNDEVAERVSRIFQELGIEYVEKIVAERHMRIYLHPKQLGENDEEVLRQYDLLHKKLRKNFDIDKGEIPLHHIRLISSVPEAWMDRLLQEGRPLDG